MSQIEADQLDDLFKQYTHYPDEEPEPLGEIGPSADVSLMHDRPDHQIFHSVEPPPFEEPSLGPPDCLPSSVGATVSTSLLGRFSLARIDPPSPSICPSELSSTSQQQQRPLSPEVPPVHATRNAVTSDHDLSHTPLLHGKRPRTSSSRAMDNGRRRKVQKRDDGSDSDSDWEPGVAARKTCSATRTTSKRSNVPRGSTKRPVPRGRPQRTTGGSKSAVRGGARDGSSSAPTTNIGISHVLRHSQRGGAPASDLFETEGSPASAIHAQLVPSRQSSTKVNSESTMSPLSDISGSTLLTPPPMEFQYPVTYIEDDTAHFDIPKDRASKIKAQYLIKQGASSDPRAPRRALPLTVQPSYDGRRMLNTELEEDNVDGTADSDGGNGDYEEDSDFSPPPTQRPLPPRRKAPKASMQRKRNPTAGKKATSRRRSAKSATGERYTYVGRDGKSRRFLRGRADALRAMLKMLHGPIWCLFCTTAAPAPDDESQFSRVKDSPKRHLFKCKHFKRSQYYERKAQKGMLHKEVVQAAVRERKTAGSIIRCPNEVRQRMLLAEKHITHAEVLYEVGRLCTVFKDRNCACCDLPVYSKFRTER